MNASVVNDAQNGHSRWSKLDILAVDGWLTANCNLCGILHCGDVFWCDVTDDHEETRVSGVHIDSKILEAKLSAG